MLREGLEAALIVGILLAYLYRLGRRRQAQWVWAGTLSAVALSVLAGALVFGTIGSLEGRAEELAEGAVAFAAAGLLTWMIFWMGARARLLRVRLEVEVDTALEVGGSAALAGVAFVAVLREGLESVLFLISTTVGTHSGAGQLLGGFLGLVAAVGIGYLIYRGGRRIDLRVFFRLTGFLIVLFAAGLVAKGVHEFQEVGLLPTVTEHLYQVGFLDPERSLLGRFAKSLFGWSPSPSFSMVVAYWAYLVPVAAAFTWMTRGRSVTLDGERNEPVLEV